MHALIVEDQLLEDGFWAFDVSEEVLDHSFDGIE
jgi:hypothetical protein